MGEFEGGDEARLLVWAAEVIDRVDDLVFFFDAFTSCALSCNCYIIRV